MINDSRGVPQDVREYNQVFTNRSVHFYFENVTSSDYPDDDLYVWNSSYDDYIPLEMDLSERAKTLLGQPIVILTLVFCFISILMNISLLLATVHCPGGIATHKKLIISLAASDLLTSLSVLAHEMNKLFNQPLVFYMPNPEDRLTSACVYTSVHAFNVTAHIITLLNLVAMAMDHYIAILMPLRYNFVMRKRRGIVLICCLWIFAVLGGFSNFIVGLGSVNSVPEFLNYCEYVVFMIPYQSDFLAYAMAPISVIIIFYIYLRVYCVVRNLNRTAPSISRELNKTMKATLTTLLIIGSFITCWLPKCLLEIVLVIRAHTDPEALKEESETMTKVTRYLYVLMLLNCILDPVIYALRLPDIQIGYRIAFCKLCRRCNCKYSTISLEQLSMRRSTATTIKYFNGDEDYALQEIHSKAENDIPLLISDCSPSQPVSNGYSSLQGLNVTSFNDSTEKKINGETVGT